LKKTITSSNGAEISPNGLTGGNVRRGPDPTFWVRQSGSKAPIIPAREMFVQSWRVGLFTIPCHARTLEDLVLYQRRRGPRGTLHGADTISPSDPRMAPADPDPGVGGPDLFSAMAGACGRGRSAQLGGLDAGTLGPAALGSRADRLLLRFCLGIVH